MAGQQRTTAATAPSGLGAAVRVDVSAAPVFWDIAAAQSYGGYLDLERLPGAQHPRSPEHDEVLLIIAHQTSELWMKLCLHELRAAIGCIQRDDLAPCFKMLARIGRIQARLVHSWDVLATLTPLDYSSFRNQLGRSSGLQSAQYRPPEFLIGNKHRDLTAVHRGNEAIHTELTRALHAPSLYEECLRLLSRRGFEIPPDRLDRDFAQPYLPDLQVTAAWLAVCHSVATHWPLCELAEKLVDLEQRCQLWRFSHLKTVERIIGYTRGTGGTSGVAYLARALELRFFPELWAARTSM